MIITLDKLRELKTRIEDIEWFTTKYDANQVELSTLVKDLKADDELGFVWRLLPQLMKNKVTRVKFSVYCAELVLPIFEQKYPDDKRPSLAIKAAKAWVDNPCEETEKAADDAAKDVAGYGLTASAASSTAYDARKAAAYAAAGAATWAAAYAANCATWVTTWAVNGAAAYAAKDVSDEFHTGIVDKIIKCGLELLEE